MVAALLVGRGDGLERFRFAEVAARHDSVDARFTRRIDKDVDGVVASGEDIVRAAADDDGAFLRGNIADDLRFGDEDRFAQRQILAGEEAAGIGRAGGEILHETVAHALFVVGDEFIGQAALLRGQGDELFIIISDAECFGDQLADLAAAAAIFTTDGDD